MKLKALLNDIKYRKSLRLVWGDILFEHEHKILTQGFSLFMLIRLYIKSRKKDMNITGIVVKGDNESCNIILEKPTISFIKKKNRFYYKNGIMVHAAPEITKTDYLHFKSVLKSIGEEK